MSETKDLKNCPFCGGRAKQRQVPGSFGGYGLTEIACNDCGATNTDAEKWNRRDIGSMLPESGQVMFGGARTGGKTFANFVGMLNQIDPNIAEMFVKAFQEAEKQEEDETDV